MKILLSATALLLLVGDFEARASMDELYRKFNPEKIPITKIKDWIEQFEKDDREPAMRLLDQLDYYSESRLMSELVQLHQKVLQALKRDNFIQNSQREFSFEKVDFSKTYVAKSGDYISYLYRSSNKIRAKCFKNISDLEKPFDRAERALVILDDYTGTGLQFLYQGYAKNYHSIFNQYKKIYYVVVVANPSALKKFMNIREGNHEKLAEDIAVTLNISDLSEKRAILAEAKNISSNKLEIVFQNQEELLISDRSDSEVRRKLSYLIKKYNLHKYPIHQGVFSEFYGRTIFPYSLPNNVPEILWDTKSHRADGMPWIPLFRRLEDLSIYNLNLPSEEEAW